MFVTIWFMHVVICFDCDTLWHNYHLLQFALKWLHHVGPQILLDDVKAAGHSTTVSIAAHINVYFIGSVNPGECSELFFYLVNVGVVSEVHDGWDVLGEELVDHGAVGLSADVGHSVLQHLVQLGLLHLRRRKQITLQKLHRRRPQRRIMSQQPADHLPLSKRTQYVMQ